MISQLGSFIEFMAAIYVTISIDNLIAKRFWTKDYGALLGDLFIKWRVPYIAGASSGKYRGIEDIQKTEESYSRRRGVFMLSFCVFLLVFIGFEPACDSMFTLPLADIAMTYFPLCVLSIYVLLVFFFDRFFLSSRSSVLLCIISLPVVFFISEYIEQRIPFNSLSSAVLSFFIPTGKYLVVVLILPVIWLLLRSWLFSHTNMVRIQHLLKEELDNLDAARRYKDGDDINTIQSWYRNDAVKRVSINGAGDQVEGDMIQTFNIKLREFIQVPRIKDLIAYINKEPLIDLSSTVVSINYSESVVPSSQVLSSPVSISFDTLCAEYDSMSKKPNLKEFAKKKQINHKKFQEYYNQWRKKNASL